MKLEIMWHWQICPASDDVVVELYSQKVAGKQFALMVNHTQNDQLVVFLDGDFGLVLVDGEIVQQSEPIFSLAGPALAAVLGTDVEGQLEARFLRMVQKMDDRGLDTFTGNREPGDEFSDKWADGSND